MSFSSFNCKKTKNKSWIKKNEEKLIKKISKKIPILKAGNMSLGINLLMYLTEITSGSLKKIF